MSATNTYLLVSMALKENPKSAPSYILKSLSEQTHHHNIKSIRAYVTELKERVAR